MMKSKVLLRGMLILLLCAAVSAFGQTAAEHILKGDEYYASFDDARALEEYLLAVGVDANNYEALWKTSRAYIDIGDLIDPKEKDAKKKQTKTYRDAENYARKAILVNSEDTWGHFYLSASMGKRALLLGKKDQVKMSKEVKEAIEKAIELDSTNDYAYHALGRWHRRMAEIGGMKRFLGGILYGGIPKGSFEESEEYLKKAVELRPDYGNHHLELGRTYLALKKWALAREEFNACLEAPVVSSKCEIYKKEAEAEIAELDKKKR